MINYRANIKALQDLGVSSVIAVNVVGGVDPTLKPGDLTLIDDFIDYTSGRIGTFFDGGDEFGVKHIDMTNVYDKRIQSALLASAKSLGIPLRTGGVYAGFNGPRFETPAEIRMVAKAGGTVVGMTGCPEAALAREIALPYAAIALIVNPAAGLSSEEITMEAINEALDLGRKKVLAILADAVSRIVKTSE
jgi:purine nucleoside phosphorylase